MSDRLWTVAQLSGRWGWSHARIYHLVYGKRIPYYKAGGRVLFRESEIERWLEAQRVPVAAPPAPLPPRALTREQERRRLGIPVDHQFT